MSTKLQVVESDTKSIRILPPKQQKFAENLVIYRMSRPDAWRDAYGRHDTKPKEASDAARQVWRSPAVQGEVRRLRAGLEEVLFEGRLQLQRERFRQVWEMFTLVVDMALEQKELKVALQAIERMGSMNACANFLDANLLLQTPPDRIIETFRNCMTSSSRAELDVIVERIVNAKIVQMQKLAEQGRMTISY
ncbi:MAG: hypothetical protein AAF709_13475 [Pseudomonadota bacterium]